MGPIKTRGRKIICLQCKAEGAVSWFLGRRRRELDWLSGGFICVDRGEADDPHCQCARCRVPVLTVAEALQ